MKKVISKKLKSRYNRTYRLRPPGHNKKHIIKFKLNHPNYAKMKSREYRYKKYVAKFGFPPPAVKLFASQFEMSWGFLLQRKFNTFTFVKIRPTWLKNPDTGRCLELDFYCETLNLAIEVNGNQHFYYTPYFHRKGIGDFEKQQKRDRYKKEQCQKLGILLIAVSRKTCVQDVLDKINEAIRVYSIVS